MSPSELETHLSAGLCPLEGCGGPTLPPHPDPGLQCKQVSSQCIQLSSHYYWYLQWSCSKCGHQVDRDTVLGVVEQLGTVHNNTLICKQSHIMKTLSRV